MKKLKLFLFIALGALSSVGFSQAEADKSWMLKDFELDGVPGVSAERAYEILKGKPSKTVIVAVLDSGVDPEHEDLKDVMWINTKEIPGNGIDDDGNGYIDDVYGWNFLGNKNGENVDNDTYELVRLYKIYHEKFNNVTSEKQVKGKDKKEYQRYKKLEAAYNAKASEIMMQAMSFSMMMSAFPPAKKLALDVTGSESLTLETLNTIKESAPDSVKQSIEILILISSMSGIEDLTEIEAELVEGEKYFSDQMNYGLSLEFEPRSIVGDNYNDVNDRYYGNGNVYAADPMHGTHVAGIIAAARNNGLGMDGVADNVKIMAIRAVPNGDERDKDIANGIYYAVNNGAKIINMSFGKGYSYDKKIVDDAVKYAEKHGVLLVHAAGNDAKNNDTTDNFPNKYYEKGGEAKNWIEVGAIAPYPSPAMVGGFSNYGKKKVDLFAPGVEIYSTTPDSKYEFQQGTSMAAPAVAGVAAVIMSYYPELTAVQVKDILMKSVQKYPLLKNTVPGTEQEVNLSEISVSGGTVNLYNAVLLAEKMSKGGK